MRCCTASLEPLDDTDFERPTLFKDWTINDILRHLHHGNILADLSLNDEVAFHETYAEIKALRDGGMDFPEATAQVLDGLGGKDLLATWREFYGAMSGRFAEADPKKRVKWVGPDMRTIEHYRGLMETWSHGQAAFDLFGVERQDTDRQECRGPRYEHLRMDVRQPGEVPEPGTVCPT